MARHESLSDQLRYLLAYRNRPTAPADPVKTNFTPVASNDNNPEDLAGLHVERRRSIRPTEREIMESVKSGDIERNDAGQIIRIGKLRFSDGSQTERAHKYSVDGKLVEYDAPMPVGAMLNTRDRQERVLGGDTVASNAAYALVYGGKHPGNPRRKNKERREAERQAPVRSKAELRAELASMAAPHVTSCKDGFPWKPSNLRELFMGLEKGKKGETGSVAWEDISTHIVEREIWAETVASLSSTDTATLNAALTADGFASLGGKGHKRTQERRGKARLMAANDNLVAAMKKSAA